MADINVDGGGGGGRGSLGRRRGRGGLRLVETILPISAAGGEDVIKDAMPFICLLSLGANVDVDPINGSYSLDNVIVVNRPSPNNKDDDDDVDDDNDGDGNGGRFSTLPLLPASTFIVIGSGGRLLRQEGLFAHCQCHVNLRDCCPRQRALMGT